MAFRSHCRIGRIKCVVLFREESFNALDFRLLAFLQNRRDQGYAITVLIISGLKIQAVNILHEFPGCILVG
ncbi:hypothetical protein D3C75_1273570 [compost metagenome]